MHLTIKSYSENSVITGFLNDNYTGSIENGVKGNYIGADDFLTFTLFVKSSLNSFKISEYYHVVTSREYGYRYDILDTKGSYRFEIENFYLEPRISLLFKGNLGGEVVQNNFHSFRNLDHLVLPYKNSETGVELDFEGGLNIDPFTLSMEFKLPSAIKPVSAAINLNFWLDLNYAILDFTAGYKQYLTEIPEYSEFLRSGVVSGGQIILLFPYNITINMGFFIFPARNLNNDPGYLYKERWFSPQFWVAFGVNGEKYRANSVVNF